LYFLLNIILLIYLLILYICNIYVGTPSVSGLQRLLRACEMAIQEIDMEINAAKTVCMRIGSRYNATYTSLTLCNGT